MFWWVDELMTVSMCWWLCQLMCLRCWCVDVLTCWRVDVFEVLMRLRCWCVGVLMCRCVDALIVLMTLCRCVDVFDVMMLMCWCVDVLVTGMWWLMYWCVDDCVDVLMCWCVWCDVLMWSMCWCDRCVDVFDVLMCLMCLMCWRVDVLMTLCWYVDEWCVDEWCVDLLIIVLSEIFEISRLHLVWHLTPPGKLKIARNLFSSSGFALFDPKRCGVLSGSAGRDLFIFWVWKYDSLSCFVWRHFNKQRIMPTRYKDLWLFIWR
jgi:hypothetical protein